MPRTALKKGAHRPSRLLAKPKTETAPAATIRTDAGAVLPAPMTGEQLLEQLLELDEWDRQLFAMFLQILRDWHGSVTPAEEYILDLVREHAVWGLTPARATKHLEEFGENFDSAVNLTAEFARKYPTQVVGAEYTSPQVKVPSDESKALVEFGGEDRQNQAFHLETARDLLRKCPSLVLAKETPEPWRTILAQFRGVQSNAD